MELTRRHALAGAAALAARRYCQSPAKAAAPRPTSRRRVSIATRSAMPRCTSISDGVNNFALADTLVLNVKKDEVNAALEKAFMPKDKMTIQFAPLVINTGGKLIVVDTGNGPARLHRARAGRAVRDQRGRRRHRSQGGRHSGDIAFPRRPRERPADRGQHAGLSQRRSVGAGGGMEVLDGRRRDEPSDQGSRMKGCSTMPAACSTRA